MIGERTFGRPPGERGSVTSPTAGTSRSRNGRGPTPPRFRPIPLLGYEHMFVPGKNSSGRRAGAGASAGFAGPPTGTGSAERPGPGRGEPSAERLEGEIIELAAHLNAGTCRFLELVAEFDRRQEWAQWVGGRSCAEWIAWRCGIDPRTAREQARVARALADHPEIHAAFRPETALLLEGAGAHPDGRCLLGVGPYEPCKAGDRAQLERISRSMRPVSTAEANDTHEGRYLSTVWEDEVSRSTAISPPRTGPSSFGPSIAPATRSGNRAPRRMAPRNHARSRATAVPRNQPPRRAFPVGGTPSDHKRRRPGCDGGAVPIRRIRPLNRGGPLSGHRPRRRGCPHRHLSALDRGRSIGAPSAAASSTLITFVT